MTTIKKILCAVDLTKASRNAFDRALSVARASKARLYILHAVPLTKRYSWRARERLDVLTKLRERAERDGVLVRVVEQHGDPAATIVLHCEFKESRPRRPWIQPPPRLATVQRGFGRRTCAAPGGVGSADRSVGCALPHANPQHCE
jgi:hypothetical protein